MPKNKALISKLLEKRGIDKAEDLSPEEQATLQGWQSVLSGNLLTVDLIKTFCQNQVKVIETRFASSGNTGEDTYLKACLHVYLNLLKVIEGPEAERESLEKYLTQLIS